MNLNTKTNCKRMNDVNGKMRCYTFSQMEKIVRANGYVYSRTNGSHNVYKKPGAKHIVLARKKHVNPCIAHRLIKENNLRVR